MALSDPPVGPVPWRRARGPVVAIYADVWTSASRTSDVSADVENGLAR
jgi:hypothetical protein